MPANPSVMMIRKLAVLAHWVPGVSLLIYQADWPPLQVTRSPWSAPDGEVWIPLNPCQFRAELLGMETGQCELIGPSLGDEYAELRINVVTSEPTTLDDTGLFTLPYDASHSAVMFATLASVTVAAPDTSTGKADTCLWDIDRPPPLHSSVDEDLGVQLISCSYHTNDTVRQELARTATFEAMLAASVDEVTLLTATS
ncbi:MAG: hypothetical protein AAGA93_10480 [Actinomycetota bacterium]